MNSISAHSYSKRLFSTAFFQRGKEGGKEDGRKKEGRKRGEDFFARIVGGGGVPAGVEVPGADAHSVWLDTGCLPCRVCVFIEKKEDGLRGWYTATYLKRRRGSTRNVVGYMYSQADSALHGVNGFA